MRICSKFRVKISWVLRVYLALWYRCYRHHHYQRHHHSTKSCWWWVTAHPRWAERARVRRGLWDSLIVLWYSNFMVGYHMGFKVFISFSFKCWSLFQEPFSVHDCDLFTVNALLSRLVSAIQKQDQNSKKVFWASLSNVEQRGFCRQQTALPSGQCLAQRLIIQDVQGSSKPGKKKRKASHLYFICS